MDENWGTQLRRPPSFLSDLPFSEPDERIPLRLVWQPHDPKDLARRKPQRVFTMAVFSIYPATKWWYSIVYLLKMVIFHIVILVGGWPTPLKHDGVRQLGWWDSRLNGQIKFRFQTTNQLLNSQWWIFYSILLVYKPDPNQINLMSGRIHDQWTEWGGSINLRSLGNLLWFLNLP